MRLLPYGPFSGSQVLNGRGNGWLAAPSVHRCPAPFVRPLRASSDDQGPAKEDIDRLKKKYFSKKQAKQRDNNSQQGVKQPNGVASQSSPAPDTGSLPLDNVNPVALGRKARKTFDEVWGQLSKLASPTKSFILDDVLEGTADSGFETPQAAYTTVLVVGATGSVGRILTRKLLLRGYKVKALVRRREGVREEQEGVPDAVQVIEGDVGEMADVQEAIRGCNKVIFCAAARSTFTGDLLRVEDRGVMNVVKALQDEYDRQSQKTGKRRFTEKSKKEIADFSHSYHQQRWDVTFVGVPDADKRTAGTAEAWSRANTAVAEITEDNNLIFEGNLLQRGAVAEVGTKLNPYLPGGEHRTKDTEGMTLRVRGDAHYYSLVLTTVDEHKYTVRFPTRVGYSTVRLPYTVFRPEKEGQPPLDPEQIKAIAIRYENRRSSLVTAARAAKGLPSEDLTGAREQKFQLEVDWIKAMQSGQEPDFILVSCAGKVAQPGLDAASSAKVVEFKRKGEDNLRNSGLGYTIIRPGTLVDEPGGYRALVFDQGDRITDNISAADVADICLRALHEPEARNKTFDVCYEFQPEEGLQNYELIARVPDKANNYLKAAVTTLQKNT